MHQRPRAQLPAIACGLLLAGIVLFSGSLYVFAVTADPRWAMITPIGGLCFMAGWIVFCVSESISNGKSA
jgi:uncharacterized membrane protein YgdD (TMEM256/DUF423 family)